MPLLYLGLGSNLGDRRLTICRAVGLIGVRIGTVVRLSSFYETEPWGFQSANRFVNAVVCVQTDLSPREVLDATKDIERSLGRTQKSVGGCYHDRIIDIDILIYGDLRIDEPDLKIPHPFMTERDFVMIPLREIMP